MSESELVRSALNKAMALCSRREYCITDIRSKLESWEIDDNGIILIINSLIGDNFINEDRFAAAFVKDKFNYNRWGKVKITAHLRSKKIPSQVITEALEAIDDETYLKVIKDLIAVHRRSVRARNNYELKAKLLRYGLSKGFESSILYDLLNVSDEE